MDGTPLILVLMLSVGSEKDDRPARRPPVHSLLCTRSPEAWCPSDAPTLVGVGVWLHPTSCNHHR